VAAVNGGATPADQVNVNATVTTPDADTITWDASPIGGGATTANNTPVAVAAGSIDNAAYAFNVTATDDGGNTVTTATNVIDATTISLDNDVPAVTAGNVTVVGCTGTAGACRGGDVPVLNWLGDTDGETDTITSATFDGSNFRAAATALVASDPGTPGTNNWSTGLAGAMDAQDDAGNTIDVTVVDNAGNVIGPITSTVGYVVDTNLPTVTVGNISVTGATGTGGAFKNGDTPVPTWDVTTEGETDTLANVSFNAANFRAGDTALAGALGAGVYTGTLSGAADAQDDLTNNVTVTVTDNAGNQTITAGTNNYTVDTNLPTIGTPGVVALNLDNNTNGWANVGDSVDYTDAAPGAGDGDTITVEFSVLTGNATATSAGNSHAVTTGALFGSTSFTETITDNVGNTVAGSTNAINVDNSAPGAMASTDVVPPSLTTSDMGSATVNFTTVSAIPANGKIQVVFGTGFNLSLANNPICSTMDGTLAISIAGQTVTITRQNDGTSQAAAAETCIINNVQNPAAIGTTGTYTIRTTDSTSNTIDEDAAVAADTMSAPGTTTTTSPTIAGGGGGSYSSAPPATTSAVAVATVSTTTPFELASPDGNVSISSERTPETASEIVTPRLNNNGRRVAVSFGGEVTRTGRPVMVSAEVGDVDPGTLGLIINGESERNFDLMGGELTFATNVVQDFQVIFNAEPFDPPAFPDTDDPAIRNLQLRGVVQGYPDGSFGPERVVNRAEFSKMMSESIGFQPFALEAGQQWYVPYNDALVDAEILKGNTPPENEEKRVESVAFALKALGYDIENLPAGESYFDDVAEDTWYHDVVALAVELELIKDGVDFNPGDGTTRGFAAELFSKAIEMMK
jgi:hypothetical protein